MPVGDPELRHLINSIALDEESDHDEDGAVMSHFEMYLSAMKAVGIDTAYVSDFVDAIVKHTGQVEMDIDGTLADGFKPKIKPEVFNDSPIKKLPAGIAQFVSTTLKYCYDQKFHKAAAAFAFGREDLIGGMFLSILRELNNGDTQDDFESDNFKKMVFYMKRHVEVDSEDHGPLCMQLVSMVCGDDDEKWEEATQVAIDVLRARAKLWDHVLGLIEA